MPTQPDITVIDCETTGLSAAAGDRIVEVALIRSSYDGRVLEEYVSLLNPQRPIDATHIHGIRDVDVADAPSFMEVAGDIVRLMRGTILAAHNANFDLLFYSSEFARGGLRIPSLPTICTMNAAKNALPNLRSYKLDAICCELGIETGESHSALDDARSTLRLLAALRERVGSRHLEFDPSAIAAAERGWPRLASSRRPKHRAGVELGTFSLVSLTDRLARYIPAVVPGSRGQSDYLTVLQRALRDGTLTDAKFAILLEAVRSLGLDMGDVAAAHRQYLFQCAMEIVKDGSISPPELRAVQSRAGILGIGRQVVDSIISDAADQSSTLAIRRFAPGLTSLEGQVLCFTESPKASLWKFPASLHEATRCGQRKGAVVATSMSKSVNFAVVPDDGLFTPKRMKARELSIPEIKESDFWPAVGHPLLRGSPDSTAVQRSH